MLSKNRLKHFASLNQKKFRKQHGSFLAEGEKIVREILASNDCFLEVATLLAVPEFIASISGLPAGVEIIPAQKSELQKVSSFNTAGNAILEIKIPEYEFSAEDLRNSPSLFFDDIRDPGNLGTIIRTADWYGIRDIFCSQESVDVYNPKVVQTSMGSFARVKVHYKEPLKLIDGLKSALPGYSISGTVLNGEDIRESILPIPGMVMFGNESRGLSEQVITNCDRLVTIPPWGSPWAESLNVGIAAAIVCAEWRRR